MDRMAELAYIPIYDLNQPEAGVVACLEVAISAGAKEALVANVISEAAELLGRLDVRLFTLLHPCSIDFSLPARLNAALLDSLHQMPRSTPFWVLRFWPACNCGTC